MRPMLHPTQIAQDQVIVDQEAASPWGAVLAFVVILLVVIGAVVFLTGDADQAAPVTTIVQNTGS